MDELKNIIESLLFVSEDPLTVDQIRKVIQNADGKTVREAIDSLRSEYERRGGGFFLAEVAGGFQLRTRPEYNEYIKDLLQPSPPRLSRAALETLAIIAYKQPIIRADLEHLRGVDSGGVLRLLLKRKLIRVLGRKEIPGRPLIYATTKRFLEMFDLKDLKDLPTPREIEELGSDASDELAAAFEALSLPADGPARPQEEPGLFDGIEAEDLPGKDDAASAPEEPADADEPEPDPPAESAAEAAEMGAPREAQDIGKQTGEPASGDNPKEDDGHQHTENTSQLDQEPEDPQKNAGGGNGAGEDEDDWESRF